MKSVLAGRSLSPLRGCLGLAWAFELTPEGIKREKDVDRSLSITPKTGRRLDRGIIVVLALAISLLIGILVSASLNGTSRAVEIDKSVAVLPFVALSRGDDDNYFADGLTEEILNALSSLPDLLVTARTSSFACEEDHQLRISASKKARAAAD